MKVPAFLSHLRTDRHGRPVPYINLWGPESVDRLAIRHDPHVGGLALFLDDDGQPEPDYFRQNMQRQRECMVRGLCQVCARPVPWSRRWLVVSSMSVDVIKLLGQSFTVLTEPWLDERCAAFAVDRCPGLIRRRSATDLQLVPVTSQRQCRLVSSTGWVDGPLEVESRRVQPIMWVKLLLTDVTVVVA